MIQSPFMPVYDEDEPKGLFDPRREYDACGVGFIVDLKARPSHQIIVDALRILENLEHRGAVGADPIAGDGGGILTHSDHLGSSPHLQPAPMNESSLGQGGRSRAVGARWESPPVGRVLAWWWVRE